MKERNDCDEVQGELTAFLYEELDARERDAIEAHLSTCAACTAGLDELRATAALLARWTAPRADDDPQALAAALAARARRPRSLPTALRLTAAAAVVAFVALTVLGSEVRLADGELTVRLSLGGPQIESEPMTLPETTLPETTPVGLESTVRRITAQEIEDWTLAQREERDRLVNAFDRLRAEDQRVLAGLLDSFQTRNARENRLTREALVDLASFVTRPE